MTTFLGIVCVVLLLIVVVQAGNYETCSKMLSQALRERNAYAQMLNDQKRVNAELKEQNISLEMQFRTMAKKKGAVYPESLKDATLKEDWYLELKKIVEEGKEKKD